MKRFYGSVFVFCLLVTSIGIVSCDDNGSSKKQRECEQNADCADRTDGKTICELATHQCQAPVVAQCNNDILEVGEACDGINLNGKSCVDMGEYVSGTLACNKSCLYDVSGCLECTDTDESLCEAGEICSSGKCVSKDHVILCGDGMVEGTEQCDKTNLNSKTCADIDAKYKAGLLACDSGCQFDTTGCWECGESLHCAGNTDGKTVCDENIHICVEPTAACDENKHCGDGEYCKVDASDAFKNACVTSSECTENGCAEIGGQQGVCSGVAWNAPGTFDACDAGCNEGQCVDELCQADTCNQAGNAYCDTTTNPLGEYVTCTEANGGTLCVDGACTQPSGDMPQIVFSHVYTGGGNTTSIYKSKYVVLFNRGSKDGVLENWSIQYGSSGSSNISKVCKLPTSVTIPAKHYYLVELTQGNNGDDLPLAPDFVCTDQKINASATKGKLFLVASTAKLASAQPNQDVIVDGIGYGAANWSEGGNPAAQASNVLANHRKKNGCTDTDNNGDDFVVAAPLVLNSASAENNCVATPEDSFAKCHDSFDNDHGEDNVDNDGNGKTDCDDTECASFCSPSEDTEATCQDDDDNDGDGFVDCADPDCSTTQVCSQCEEGRVYLPKYQFCACKIASKEDYINYRSKWNTDGTVGLTCIKDEVAYFLQTADIDLGEDTEGFGTPQIPFKGVYHGGEHKISVKQEGILDLDSEVKVNGLFGYVVDGTIENLKVVALDTHQEEGKNKWGDHIGYHGVLVGYGKNCKIHDINLKAQMNISLSDENEMRKNEFKLYMGALAGLLEGKIDVKNITADVKMTYDDNSQHAYSEDVVKLCLKIGGLVGEIADGWGEMENIVLNPVSIDVQTGWHIYYSDYINKKERVVFTTAFVPIIGLQENKTLLVRDLEMNVKQDIHLCNVGRGYNYDSITQNVATILCEMDGDGTAQLILDRVNHTSANDFFRSDCGLFGQLYKTQIKNSHFDASYTNKDEDEVSMSMYPLVSSSIQNASILNSSFYFQAVNPIAAIRWAGNSTMIENSVFNSKLDYIYISRFIDGSAVLLYSYYNKALVNVLKDSPEDADVTGSQSYEIQGGVRTAADGKAVMVHANENISALPSGTYLPWITVNNHGSNIVIVDTEAPESQWVTVD